MDHHPLRRLDHGNGAGSRRRGGRLWPQASVRHRTAGLHSGGIFDRHRSGPAAGVGLAGDSGGGQRPDSSVSPGHCHSTISGSESRPRSGNHGRSRNAGDDRRIAGWRIARGCLRMEIDLSGSSAAVSCGSCLHRRSAARKSETGGSPVLRYSWRSDVVRRHGVVDLVPYYRWAQRMGASSRGRIGIVCRSHPLGFRAGGEEGRSSHPGTVPAERPSPGPGFDRIVSGIHIDIHQLVHPALLYVRRSEHQRSDVGAGDYADDGHQRHIRSGGGLAVRPDATCIHDHDGCGHLGLDYGIVHDAACRFQCLGRRDPDGGGRCRDGPVSGGERQSHHGDLSA